MNRRTVSAWIALGAVVALGAPVAAQPSEQAVKAAFLPKFARYVSWPPLVKPAAGAPIQLCIIGADGLGRTLDEAVAGQTVDQHPMIVRRMATAAEAAGCHLAFVSTGNAQTKAAALAALRSRPVLTVTDGGDGGGRGMIHFTLHRGRIRFHVDAAAAEQSRLTLDSRLLRVALSVKQRRP